MQTLEEFEASLSGLAGDSVWDAFQHQGTPKRAAYEHMGELVELKPEPNLWELVGTIGAYAATGLSRVSPQVRAGFEAALKRARERMLQQIDVATAEDEVLKLLGAIAGVEGRTRVYEILDEFGCGSVEHYCPRCGARVHLERRGASVIARWRKMERTVSADAHPQQRGGPLESPGIARWPELSAAVAGLLGIIPCPRCDFAHSVIESPRGDVDASSLRRREHPRGECTLTGYVAAIESLEQRLDEISRNRSEDVVRLAGAGFFRVVHYKAYSGRDPERGLIVQVPAKARRQFEVDDALYELVNGRPCPPILKSDAAELDALAWQVLLAFEEYDVVKIPGIGSIRIELKRARPGATVDGDPIIVPERWVVRFRA